MKLEMSLNGLEEYKDRIKKAPDKASQGAELAMKAFVVQVKSDVQKSLNIREMSGKSYIPSEPGQPPHKRTGNLYKSVYNSITKLSQFKIQGTVGDNAQSDKSYAYPSALEFGTSKMQPRPYLRPAIEKNKNMFVDLFKKIMDRL